MMAQTHPIQKVIYRIKDCGESEPSSLKKRRLVKRDDRQGIIAIFELGNVSSNVVQNDEIVQKSCKNDKKCHK